MYKKNLILSLIAATTIFTGCNDEKEIKKVDTKEIQTPTTQATKQDPVDNAAQTVINNVESTAKKVEEIAQDIQKSVAPTVTKTAEKIKEVQKTISETSLDDVKQKITEATAPLIASVKEVTSSPDGAKLFTKCIGCHGQKGQNAALGKSQVIKGWDANKISEALQGYKSGTYGGAMKGIMQSQVKSMSDNEIDAVSKHIASF